MSGYRVDISGEELLLFARRPSRRQTAVVGGIALLLLLASALTLPFGHHALHRVNSFIPVVDTIQVFNDVLTATLLFAQASVLRSHALIALATGYLLAGLMILAHGLTFPGAFAPSGLLGAGASTGLWLHVCWHLGLRLAFISYAYFKRPAWNVPIAHDSIQPAVAASILGATLLAIALTLLATAGEPWLPVLMTDAVNWKYGPVMRVLTGVLCLTVVAMMLLWRSDRSVLDLWLLLVLWASLIEIVLVMNTAARFSTAWYVGRTISLLSTVFVLIMLLAETNRLYARLVVSATAQRHERESRLISMNAVAASIAHEIKQPLSAIVFEADAGLTWLGRDPPRVEELPAILEAIAAAAHHASSTIDSIRTMFGAPHGERVLMDVNELVRETLTFISGELASHRISLELRMAEGLPPVHADRMQMRHVLLNLFTNAVEAMIVTTERARQLSVRTMSSDTGRVTITVEDSGVGFDPADADRLFEAFFTTKPQGTGLGLPLCRSIVEAHDGQLQALPRVPHGAAVQLTLPHRAPLAGDRQQARFSSSA